MKKKTKEEKSFGIKLIRAVRKADREANKTKEDERKKREAYYKAWFETNKGIRK